MDAWLSVQHSAHVNTAAAGDTAHVVELCRRERLSYFPFARKLTNVRFGFLVNVERTKVAAARRFVERNVGCGTVLPIFGKGT
jgi:hypothetical protein